MNGSIGACGNYWPRTDLYRGLQTFFVKTEREILYIYIYDICSFLTFTTWACWQSSYFLNSHLTPWLVSVKSPYCYQCESNDTRHCYLQSSIIIPRWTCWKSTVGLKKKVFVFWWKVLLLKNMSIEPRAMHWVDHCVCLLEIFKKAKKKREKKSICFKSVSSRTLN